MITVRMCRSTPRNTDLHHTNRIPSIHCTNHTYFCHDQIDSFVNGIVPILFITLSYNYYIGSANTNDHPHCYLKSHETNSIDNDLLSTNPSQCTKSIYPLCKHHLSPTMILSHLVSHVLHCTNHTKMPRITYLCYVQIDSLVNGFDSNPLITSNSYCIVISYINDHAHCYSISYVIDNDLLPMNLSQCIEFIYLLSKCHPSHPMTLSHLASHFLHSVFYLYSLHCIIYQFIIAILLFTLVTIWKLAPPAEYYFSTKPRTQP
eukprot:987029_1